MDVAREESCALPTCFDSEEASKRLGISSRTLKNLQKNGAISFVRIGRLIKYRQQDLDEFLSANAVPAGAAQA